VRRFAFVTASSELRDRVRALFHRLRAGAGEAIDADACATPASLAGCPASAWPLFLTSADWMRLADGATAQPFFRRAPDGSLATPHAAPASWRDASAPAASAACRRPDVDAAIFRARFWPSLLAFAAAKLPAAKRELTDGAAAAVWREIVSFIKGSSAAAAAGKPLSREEYVALPHKIAPAFAGDARREAVYDLFCRYEVLKRSAKPFPMHDACDIALHVAAQHAAAPPAPHLEALFVDEVQDLCQLELLLLVRAVRDARSLFLAGDTAQTVAAGVAFRFEDARALLRTHAGVACGGAVACLALNYRSHDGIVAAAASVARLLMQLFPAAVDRTPPERGCFAGARPLLVTHTRAADVLQLILDGGDNDDDDGDASAREPVDFGAHQVFLVRDDAARAALLADVPELRLLKGQVLSVAESKGLEFTDVICWNLASWSPFEHEWRVVAAAAQARWEAGGAALEAGDAAAAAARVAAAAASGRARARRVGGRAQAAVRGAHARAAPPADRGAAPGAAAPALCIPRRALRRRSAAAPGGSACGPPRGAPARRGRPAPRRGRPHAGVRRGRVARARGDVCCARAVPASG
jgi:hypothetical protein